MTQQLTASHFSLTGAGFVEPARYGFAERCAAAAEAGFTGIGLRSDEYAELRASHGVDYLRSSLTQAGIAVSEIEFMSGWTTADPDPATRASHRDLLEMADALAPHHVTAGEFGAAEVDVEVAGRGLRAVSEQAARHGLRVAVEAFPWSGLQNLATVRRVLDLADAPNAGVMVDVWHFFNSRSTFEDLVDLGVDKIVAVQLNDGRLVDDDFLTEARARRMLPGDGELDIPGLLRCLRGIGFRGPYCVEVGYPEYRALPVEEMARLAYEKAMAVLI